MDESKTISKGVILIAILCGSFLAGCESDPLLSPQNPTAQDVGSYGSSTLNNEQPPSSKKTEANPETF